ncbi:MAG TPA: YihY/virulence factor BrkB family protein [Candidatus Coprenecus stercoravium]|uniref:YihY/virulence factor BrkB family protein n=1 Tax=Candidatus Coprenecus stercoravium TaxID=2840735 RepID=A0A9D2GR47_9BACT|nr:YihY/virulence factor BrkB family protein [Candidatus Coprenecus stercoravium]
MRCAGKIRRTAEFLRNGIWNLNLDDLGRFKARVVRYIRIVILAAKNFSRQHVGLQAVALSFFTTMAFVPFLAMAFAIANYAGLGTYLRDLIYENFGHDMMVDQILNFADNIVATSQQGIYGIISFLIFMWMVIWLISQVEMSFNRIWKVEKNRILWKRTLAYLVTMISSPFIIIVFLSVSLTITDGINTLGVEIPYLESISTFLVWLAFFIFMLVCLTAMYILIPNAKVRFLPALSAAVISALAFTVVQYLYLETQMFVSRLNAIYGVFAAIPLFMVWLNIGWFIVLLGSDLSYVFQNADNYPLEDIN